MVRLRARGLRCAAPLLLLSLPAFGESKDEEIADLKQELAATREQLGATRSALDAVERRLDQLEAGPSAAAPSQASTPPSPRLPPVNADNPAISFVVDTTARYDTQGDGFDFTLRSGELFISAPIDPFLRGYVSLNGNSEEGFELEEAALVTTALPWNLTLKGGRFHADFGRLPHWHDEQLPFTDRPTSIDRIIGGESSAEGVELAWLVPIDPYLRVTAGLYDSIGAERREELMENGFAGRRAFDELTWLVHPATYFDLTEALNLELGGSFATVADRGQRFLYGVDATLRHQPGTSDFYQGFVLGSEWLWNDEDFQDFDSDPDPLVEVLVDKRFARNGGYAYLEGFFGRRYSLGVRGDYAEEIVGEQASQRTWSAFATWQPSEFHRLRFQFDQVGLDGAQDDQRFTLQWTGFLGSHTHGFMAR